eukprot:IDg18755t1
MRYALEEGNVEAHSVHALKSMKLTNYKSAAVQRVSSRKGGDTYSGRRARDSAIAHAPQVLNLMHMAKIWRRDWRSTCTQRYNMWESLIDGSSTSLVAQQRRAYSGKRR